MMSHFVPTLLALFLAFCAFQVDAVPIQGRQIGNLQCNVARVKIVASLAATNSAVKAIDTTDPSTAAAVTAAQTGLSDAGDGIKTIAQALLTGQAAPAAARDQVQTGLLNAQTALGGINGTDAAVASSVTAAQAKLTDAINAGDDVVSNCK